MTEPAQKPADSEPAEPEGEVRASFWDHLKELRTRLAHARRAASASGVLGRPSSQAGPLAC